MKEAMAARGLTVDAVAKRIGINKKTFANYLTDISEPKFEVLIEFCEVVGVDVGDIIRRDTDAPINISVGGEGSDYVEVNILDVELAAGAGRVAPSPEVTGQLAFRAEWLNRMGINPAHASLVRVSGSSMEPTLPDGATVLIDHRSRTMVNKSMIYACRLGDDLVVKRLERSMTDSSILLHSDNPSWPTTVIGDPANADFEIIGRVVWKAETLPDAV